VGERKTGRKGGREKERAKERYAYIHYLTAMRFLQTYSLCGCQ